MSSHLLNHVTRMKFGTAIVTCCCLLASAHAGAAPLKAGVAWASINPMEAKIPTPLGGYGAREGKPAQGTLDTIYGKAVLFELDGQKSALITVDTCTVPLCVAEETLKKAGIEGLTLNRLLIAASHTRSE